jgi:pyruvate/oxaloacetate carboxyltransferase
MYKYTVHEYPVADFAWSSTIAMHGVLAIRRLEVDFCVEASGTANPRITFELVKGISKQCLSGRLRHHLAKHTAWVVSKIGSRAAEGEGLDGIDIFRMLHKYYKSHPEAGSGL